MSSNAPGQMLGYTLQLQRALVYLLQSGVEHCVSVELIGDVGLHSATGAISEEDKSSVNSNPVTNKSKDLWKTFYNWKKSINDGKLTLDKMRFILYSNHPGNIGIVDWFSDARTEDEIENAIDKAKEILSDIPEDHELFKYIDYVFDDLSFLSSLISKFEFIIGSKSSDIEIKQELIKKLIPESYLDYIHDALLGWITNLIMNKIKNKEEAVITWKDYSKKFTELFRRIRARELIDFTSDNIPTQKELENQKILYPYYIQQLDIIGIDEEDQVRAVSDYMRSKVNIDAWIENEIIDESNALNFENALIRFWSNSRKMLMITSKHISAEERGAVLNLQCMSRTETISNQSPPPSTIPGAYHSLADEDKIGWHEKWQEILNRKREK